MSKRTMFASNFAVTIPRLRKFQSGRLKSCVVLNEPERGTNIYVASAKLWRTLAVRRSGYECYVQR